MTMDALMLLTADHNRVRGLFAKFRAAHESEDAAEMAEVATKILTELDVHAEIEEQIFYPAISEASEEIRETVSEGVEEHHVVKTLAAEIEQLPPGDEQWTAKLTVLIENVEHHAEEEESEMFPSVRKAMNTEALVELGEQLEALKAQLGAPTAADKEPFSTEELKEMAKEQEIPGRSSMSREELVATVAPE
jgi:hemerythrin superfamily protein